MAIWTCLPFVVIQIAAAETFRIYMSSYYEGRSAIAPTHAASLQSIISFTSHPNSTIEKNLEAGTLKDLAGRTDNSLIQALTKGKHYTLVNLKPVSSPRLVLYSPEVGQLIGLLEEESRTAHFTQVFAGNVRFGKKKFWATYYGRHMYGEWVGDFGDGRAMSIGEIAHNGKRLEIQLKGSGETSYSKSFGEYNGRASIAEGIREFLTSEAMFHLGVPTTRALSLVEHLQVCSSVSQRTWGDAEFVSKRPSEMNPARDFLNQHKPVFANLEILGQCFLRLNLHMCKCWIDSSSSMEPIPGQFEQAKQEITAVLRTGFRDARIASLEREIPRKLGLLGSRRAVALWYDATVLCLETSVDYTTFFRCLACLQMEEDAWGLALAVSKSKPESTKKASGKKELNLSQEHAKEGQARGKLNDTAQANTSSTDAQMRARGAAVILAIEKCFGCVVPRTTVEARSWAEWFKRYDEARSLEGRTAEVRRREMDSANPKYVLRGTMLRRAAEAAVKGNYWPAKEIIEVLRRPYDEQSDAVEKLWCSDS